MFGCNNGSPPIKTNTDILSPSSVTLYNFLKSFLIYSKSICGVFFFTNGENEEHAIQSKLQLNVI